MSDTIKVLAILALGTIALYLLLDFLGIPFRQRMLAAALFVLLGGIDLVKETGS